MGFLPFLAVGSAIEVGGRGQPLLSALRAGVLSFASPKESSQRKGDPNLRGRLAPTPLRYSLPAGAAELGLRPQTVLALFPPAAALLGASDGDPKGVAGTATVHQNESARRLLKKPNAKRGWSNPDAFPGPLRGAEQRRNAGGFRLALFEPQASSGKPPGVSSSAGNTRRGHRPRGRLLPSAAKNPAFAYFLLAKQKKVRRPQGGKHRMQSDPISA